MSISGSRSWRAQSSSPSPWRSFTISSWIASWPGSRWEPLRADRLLPTGVRVRYYLRVVFLCHVLKVNMPKIHTPDWVKDAVFYQIFPDRFGKSDKVLKPRNLEEWDSP